MKLLLCPLFLIITVYSFAFDELIDAKYNYVSASWSTTTGDSPEARSYGLSGFIQPAHGLLLGYDYANLENREIIDSLNVLREYDDLYTALTGVSLVDLLDSATPTGQVAERIKIGYIFKSENYHFIPLYSTGDVEVNTANTLMADVEQTTLGAMLRFPFSENSIFTINVQNLSYGDFNYTEAFKEDYMENFNSAVDTLNDNDETLNLEPMTDARISDIETSEAEILKDTKTIVSLGLEYYNDIENFSVSYEISTIDFDSFGFRLETSYNF